MAEEEQQRAAVEDRHPAEGAGHPGEPYGDGAPADVAAQQRGGEEERAAVGEDGVVEGELEVAEVGEQPGEADELAARREVEAVGDRDPEHAGQEQRGEIEQAKGDDDVGVRERRTDGAQRVVHDPRRQDLRQVLGVDGAIGEDLAREVVRDARVDGAVPAESLALDDEARRATAAARPTRRPARARAARRASGSALRGRLSPALITWVREAAQGRRLAIPPEMGYGSGVARFLRDSLKCSSTVCRFYICSCRRRISCSGAFAASSSATSGSRSRATSSTGSGTTSSAR